MAAALALASCSSGGNGQAGTQTVITLQAIPTKGGTVTAAGLDAARQVIIARAATLGAKHAMVDSIAPDEVTVAVPTSEAHLVAAIADVGTLSFRPFLKPKIDVPSVQTFGHDPGGPPVDQWTDLGFAPPTTPAELGELPASRASAVQEAIDGWGCMEGLEALDIPTMALIACNQANSAMYLLGPAVVYGSEIESVIATAPGTEDGQTDWRLVVELNSTGQRAWADYTSKHNAEQDPDDIADTVALTLNGRVLVISPIQGPVVGRLELSVGSTQNGATDLARTLSAGVTSFGFRLVASAQQPRSRTTQ